MDGLHLWVSLDEVLGVPPSQPHAEFLSLLQVLDGDESGGGREVGRDLGLPVTLALQAHAHEAGTLNVRILLVWNKKAEIKI